MGGGQKQSRMKGGRVRRTEERKEEGNKVRRDGCGEAGRQEGRQGGKEGRREKERKGGKDRPTDQQTDRHSTPTRNTGTPVI